jgi:hypothetical protein
MKSKWPELEKRKAELQKQLEGAPVSVISPVPVQGGATNKAFIWTPKGVVPK